MTDIAGHLAWTRGLRGFVASKQPLGYQRRNDEPEPVAMYPLGRDEFALRIAILEVRYPCAAKLEDEPRVKLNSVA